MTIDPVKSPLPGNEYPVFETPFGKVGMMVCYDGFFPEVARELSNRGAEVIAWPVWGCNPRLGSARACENHVYIVSSTYTDVSSDCMISGVYGQDGSVLAQAKDWEALPSRKWIWTSACTGTAWVTSRPRFLIIVRLTDQKSRGLRFRQGYSDPAWLEEMTSIE